MVKNDNYADYYTKLLHLYSADFARIIHKDTMVADVYTVSKDQEQFILKVCQRPNDFYREKYFLDYFKDKIPIF